MDGKHCAHAGGQLSGNRIENSNEPVNAPGFSPQLTGSVFFSFPPPPCVPSPVNTQQIATNLVLQPATIPSHNANLGEGEATASNEQRLNTDEDNGIAEVTDNLSKNLTLAGNGACFNGAECVPRPGSSVDYPCSAPYSVILPHGSFVQPYGQSVSVPAPLYHHFSPVLPAAMSQVRPIYPINLISNQDTFGTSPGYINVQPASAPDCPMQPVRPPPPRIQPDHVPSVPEASWSSHSGIAANPPVLWGHYVAADKTGVPVGTQQFFRRHSLVNDSAVVTPTNVCPPCSIAGIVSATPEFIHPRKPDVPQWLMSPPVGEQDPSIISYAPMLYHNVRYPSVAGIAFPVMGPVGSSISSTNAIVDPIEPSRLDSPSVVLPSAQCYEVVQPPLSVSNAETLLNPAVGVESKNPPEVVDLSSSDQRPSCSVNSITKNAIQQAAQSQNPAAHVGVMPDSKHPTPDIFNRWPNIPPPPPPISEEDDCQSVCSGGEIYPDALPLAAALFPNEPVECCHGNEEDSQMQTPSYPIGVFWDIENCAVPTGKSSLGIVQRVRERFFAGHQEAEFMCVCDINKESRHVIQDLNNAQVNVVHINATAKNAADDKLRQSIRRFAHNHPAPATLVLITGDSNFTSEVSDLRHRHKYFVVLIHPAHANQALKQAATTVICYEQLVADLPIVHVSPKTSGDSPNHQLLVSSLPLNNDANAVRARLRQLSENCGGRVTKLSMGTAVLKFATADAANRALKRLEGEDVFGHRIKVTVLRQSPTKNGRNHQNFSPARNFERSHQNKQHCEQPQPNFIPPQCEGPRNVISHQSGNVPPSVNVPPAFPPFPQPPPPILGPPPFSLHPVVPPQFSTSYNATIHPSPNIPPSGYSSMPPPPQPQVFHPSGERSNDSQEGTVKLTISNIDAQLGVSAIQDIILKQISGFCQILDMKVRPHNRFTVVCDVTVPHVQDASKVLQHLQRQKIGTKRVLVTLAQQNWDEFGCDEALCLKRDCFAILKDASEQKMPLYRFFNIYLKRFQHKIKLDELRQIPDVVLFKDSPAGREIYLNPNIQDEQSFEQHLASLPRSGRSTPDINHDFLLPVCKLHYPTDAPRQQQGEKEGLLKIEMGLREFSAKLHALLHSHNGILQLDGFEYCYRAEYGTFPFPKDMNGGGVIVEHQASYVPGVQIITSQPHCLGVKAIVWAQPQSDTGSDTASDTSGASRWKSPNLIYFSREVVDLLKDKPYCCLPYDNFGSAYQLHFRHACRPSDYGFTRLADLLAAIPHVLQIMGSLSNRILTLTHRAQVKRFTQEVVKILKSTPDRAILVAQMPELYNGTFSRVWRLRDYGVSVLSDLLDDIPEGHICTTGEGDNIVLSLPIRERSQEEKERTNQFGREVVKILRGRPHYRMPFTDFVPAYHRQFGRQCKLANYGFSKLVDLFEALPIVVQIIEKGTEKFLALTEVEQQKILSIQITSILRAQIPPAVPIISAHCVDTTRKNDQDGPTLPLACIPALFQQKYGFPLIPQELNSTDLDDLMKKLSHAIRVVVNNSGDKIVRLADRKPIRLLSARLLALLLDQTADQLDIEQLHNMYVERYKESIDPNEYGFLSFSDIIRKALPGVVKMDVDAPECLVHLKPLYKEARAIRSVLLKNNGTMTMGEFNFAYLTTFHRPVDCEKLGFPTFESLLRALPNVLIVKGFGAKRTLTLRNHMQFGPLTAASMNEGSNVVHGSASLDDLQALEASRPYQSAWMPKAPPSMVPYWKRGERQAGPLPISSSAGNFRSGVNDKKEKLRFGLGRPAPNWIPPSKISLPERQASSYLQTSQIKTQVARLSPDQRVPSSACTFTIGEVPTSSSSSNCLNSRTPVRRGVSMSVITLPNGSTPIASTSSCSSASTPKSVRSSRSSDEYSDGSSSSDENCRLQKTKFTAEFSSLKKTGVSSLPNSPFPRITATAFVGPLSSIRNGHPSSEHGSPGRIQLAASFPTLTQT